MASNGIVASTRLQLQTILDPVVDVVLGLQDEGASDEFFNDIVSAHGGALLVIRPGKHLGISNQLKTFDFEVELKLYFAYANNADFDYIDLENLYEDIYAAVFNMSNYDDDKGSVPFDDEGWQELEELKQNPRVVMSKMTLKFKGSI